MKAENSIEPEIAIYLPLLFYILAILLYMITVENNFYKALDVAMIAPTVFIVIYPIFRYIGDK